MRVSNPLASHFSAFATLAVFGLRLRGIGPFTYRELSLSAGPGSVYRIDYTDRLGIDNWQEFGTFAAPVTANDFANSQMRFYRAVYLRSSP